MSQYIANNVFNAVLKASEASVSCRRQAVIGQRVPGRRVSDRKRATTEPTATIGRLPIRQDNGAPKQNVRHLAE